jgi:Spy/CpxP family protein refolding chaperone
MKLNLIPLKIATVTAAIGATATISPGQASSPNQIAQTYPALKGIQLTPAQQEKIQPIRKNAIVQLSNTLTPEQKETIVTAIGNNNEDLRTALSRLELSSDQRSKIRPILQSAYQQIVSELTPAQRKQMQQNVRVLIMGGFR